MAIERIYVRAVSGAPHADLKSAPVESGEGIKGDRYFGRHDEPGQNASFVEAEEIEAFQSAHGMAHDLSVTGRNFVTRGVRLNALVGREFTVGTVRFRGVELCEPCMGLGRALQTPEVSPAAVVKALVHKAGLRADVLSGGEIHVGARVEEA